MRLCNRPHFGAGERRSRMAASPQAARNPSAALGMETKGISVSSMGAMALGLWRRVLHSRMMLAR